MILLDTNLLGRMTDSLDPQCAATRRAIGVLSKTERLVIVPQNLYEFWAIATRSKGRPPAGQNGLGLTCEQASQWIRFFQRRFTLLPDREELLKTWHDLVRTSGTRGLKSHDARLASAMQIHGISRLLTFNGADFKGFAITTIDPATV